ncbi:hypothetical protein HIM_03821 [Hirsutella minnesotensis 3608]|uniref:Uncharacterized protein n=1 Tax=Hirsutella minnesotensis 3608 TaxID=1043627 RepID=A0A0F8A6E6_9HYPO|nr:hypothetical protein HIM_03821 [Hirsutella minnesotensis 3608]
MLVKQLIVAALFTVGSVSAIANPEPESEHLVARGDRRCNNDRWSYWNGRGCSCRQRKRWDSRRRHCY